MDSVDDKLDAFTRIAQAVAEDIFEVRQRLGSIEQKLDDLSIEVRLLKRNPTPTPAVRALAASEDE